MLLRKPKAEQPQDAPPPASSSETASPFKIRPPQDVAPSPGSYLAEETGTGMAAAPSDKKIMLSEAWSFENAKQPAGQPSSASAEASQKTAITGGEGDSSPKDLLKDTRTQKIKPPKEMSVLDGEARRLLKISCHHCQQKLDVTFLEPFSHFNCPSCDADLIVPKWFDNYLLEEPGGIGGMATVYRALDIALDREVAIKVLNPDVASEKDRSELFLHEARTAATINHYAVIPIYTCGVFENQPYIVMQYMGGGSLETKLKLERGLLPIPSVVKWVRDVAEGLDNARRHGIIHHDIKPGNIMLDSDGNAKIGDFGIAQAINDSRDTQIFEMTKSWISPHYVSPEKVNSGKEDFLGDVYSLGATFYHLITGFTPFCHNDIDELIRMRLRVDPTPPHSHRPEISPQLSRLMLAMMDKAPDKRPHYREIVKSLSEFLKTAEKPKGQQPPKQQRPLVQTTVNQKRLNDAFGASPPSRRRPALLSLSYHLAILLAICGILFYGWRSGRLQQFLPFLPKPPSQTFSASSSDMIPEASQSFASGDAAMALQIAERTFESISADPAARTQAALQMALAYSLLNSPAAGESCSAIAERLAAIEAVDPGGIDMELHPLGSTPSQKLVNFLAKQEISPEELSEALSDASPSLRLAGSLAILLRSMRLGAPQETILAAFAKFQADAAQAPDNLWSSAWKRRIEPWGRCLQGSPGSQPAALEPLFIPFATKTPAPQPKQPSPGKTGGGVKLPARAKEPARASAAGSQPLLLQISSEAISTASSAVSASRPKPDGLEFVQADLDAHLAGLPQERKPSEQERAAIVSSLKNHICKLMLRIPYECESFSSKSEPLGKGVLIGNPNYLSFKDQSGKRSRLEWKDVPIGEYLKILGHYATIREQAIASSVLGADEKGELASDYLRIAVLCDWYGLPGESAEFAKKAIASDAKVAKDVERLLLK